MKKPALTTIILVRNNTRSAYGGAEKYQLELAKLLKASGLQPIILTSSRQLNHSAKKANIPVTKSLWWSRQNWSGRHNLLLPAYFVWQFILLCWYLQIIIRYKPTVLHLQSQDDFIAGTLAGKLLKVRVIWTDHADFRWLLKNVDQEYKNLIGKTILRLAKFTSSIITVSNYEYSYLTKNPKIKSRFGNKLRVIHNGAIDVQSQYSRQSTRSKITLCFVGRAVAEKGIHELLQAFSELAPTYRNLCLDICGHADSSLTKQYRAHKNITFHSHLDDPLPILAAAHLFVLPTHKEGLSLALTEACMMQKAIITTNVDGNPEIIIDHQTGLLVDPQNTKQLKTAIKNLIDHPKLRQKLASAARQNYLDNFNFATIVRAQIIPLYTC